MTAPEEIVPAEIAGDKPVKETAQGRKGGAAVLVAIGILASRVFGVLRQSLSAKYLGASGPADAFAAAFKFTNILQNLFGEGALSASFIPTYSRLLAQGDEEEAGRVAGAIASLLALFVAVIVLVGVVLTPLLIPLIAPGFEGERRELTIRLTRILFPGAGIFVMSAWCLGILNSHRRYLLSYSAPVLWNVAMIGALFAAGPRQSTTDLAVTLAWASVVGAALQFLVQLPTAVRLAKHLRLHPYTTSPNVRQIAKSSGPVFVSRGVVQISSYIDQILSSLLPKGMVATFSYASTIAVLPVSLFGMAVSAAELPEMSRATGTDEEVATYLRGRLAKGLRHIAYFVIPSAAAFLALGDVLAGLLFQYGKFTPRDTLFAWGILGGASVGLLASTMGRLYSSTYYALHDTKTPLRFAMLRVALTTVLGYLFALPIPRLLGLDPHWGGAGLTMSAGIAGWVEFSLLRSRLNRRIGPTGVPARFVALLWTAAAVAAAGAWAMRLGALHMPKLLGELAVLGTYGVIYLGMTVALGIPEARAVVARVRR
ncbi:MAG: integral rane protein MviN [Gemmatimonadetes bacterium]|nr:integral rane protein MviN [Gemmatimonadota bacterium]